ncbi:MAG: carboxypeptidase regulatory-like domain-containing protein, partial [Candidatus Hydrogenedentes bacterium]|nr:carboxypeptidase regulatory-like domain-containing protein [Candidatus Hydrogenedentota bacterium]
RDYPWAILLLAYLAGLLLFLGLFAAGHARIRTWIRHSVPAESPQILTAIQDAAQILRLARPPEVRNAPSLHAPSSVGLIHRIVLFPESAAAHMTDAELRAVAIHETAHLKRRDPLILSLIALVRAMLYFHPLVWLAARQITNLAEQAADDAVLDATGQPLEYAKLLTRLAEGLPRRTPSPEFAAGIVLSQNVFLRRVEAILSHQRAQLRRLTRWALACTCLGLVLSLALAAAVPLAESREGNAAKSVSEEASRDSIESTIHEETRGENNTQDLPMPASNVPSSGAPSLVQSSINIEEALEGIHAYSIKTKAPRKRLEYTRTYPAVGAAAPVVHHCVLYTTGYNFREEVRDRFNRKVVRYLYNAIRIDVGNAWRSPQDETLFLSDLPPDDVPNAIPVGTQISYHVRGLAREAGFDLFPPRQAVSQEYLQRVRDEMKFFEAKLPGGDPCVLIGRGGESDAFAPRQGWAWLGTYSGPLPEKWQAIRMGTHTGDFLVRSGIYFPRSLSLPDCEIDVISFELAEDLDPDSLIPPAPQEGWHVMLEYGVWPQTAKKGQGISTDKSIIQWSAQLDPSSQKKLIASMVRWNWRFLYLHDEDFPRPFYDRERDELVWTRIGAGDGERSIVFEGIPLPKEYGIPPWESVGNNADRSIRVYGIVLDEAGQPGHAPEIIVSGPNIVSGTTSFPRRIHLDDSSKFSVDLSCGTFWFEIGGRRTQLVNLLFPGMYRLQLYWPSKSPDSEIQCRLLKTEESLAAPQNAAIASTSRERGQVTGSILDLATGKPVPGAFVAIDHTGDAGGSNLERFNKEGTYVTAETDEQGRFALENVALLDYPHPFYITADGYVRHAQEIKLTPQTPMVNLEVKLTPGARLEVTLPEFEQSAENSHTLVRLSSAENHRFFPPREDWPVREYREERPREGKVVFGELPAGTYTAEAFTVKPSALTYVGSTEPVPLASGQSAQIAVQLQANNTEVKVTVSQDSEFASQYPGFLVLTRDLDGRVWEDTLGWSMEDERLGWIQARALLWAPAAFEDTPAEAKRFAQVWLDHPFTVRGLPPGHYNILAGNVSQFGLAVRSVTVDLATNPKTEVEIPWQAPTGGSHLSNRLLFALENTVRLDQERYTLPELCTLFARATSDLIGFEPAPNMPEAESVLAVPAQMRDQDVSIRQIIEYLYLLKSWDVQEQWDEANQQMHLLLGKPDYAA